MMSTIPSPTDTDALANRINFHTRDLHNEVDKAFSVKFMMALRHSFIYTDILKTFYTVFGTVEQRIDELIASEGGDGVGAILGEFYVPEFRRADKIKRDLVFLGEWDTVESGQWTPPPQLAGFLQYLRSEMDRDPITVLAPCHVLYLALFAGGRVFKSSLFKNLGFLPNFRDKNGPGEEMSDHTLVSNATNFFQFAETIEDENKLRWTYKRNYELATRDTLTEDQKLAVIAASRDVFRHTFAVIEEICQQNHDELMSFRSFKIVTYFLEEWKFNKNFKRGVLWGVAFLAQFLFVVLYCCFLRR
ncbi:Hmx1p KNAG_0B02640 [Huiozyma naganishii CBS 8797]|uniref:Heme oxygenase n=1 Tax=Huiozyma naganishii (strain ATCC MYA-139 / BCRC 22969 / CBS 8797 / KCTC 17520 / NBRC 10181 / NCYC 3082 / Yp74L-3) TaxID=1071383 RepID=J7RUZ7_HUIN7|nr:hypothetical protein KNAG_0B02640 [Kazachstania naganishii CBS 8797]CCK68707.1 hypothetical protein KNAG_0B02640 [Kazachstania naganishii CBS 8797]